MHRIQMTKEEANSNDKISNIVDILEDIDGLLTKVNCRCKQCGVIFKMDWAHLKRGQAHEPCARHNAKVKSHEQYEKEIHEKYPEIILLSKYNGTHNKIKCQCMVCNTVWECWATNLIREQAGCPMCRSSIGEYNIAKYLLSNDIKFERQYAFEDCVYKDKLRFDFYLPDYRICIEFQGEQHYFPVDFKGHGKEEAQEAFDKLKVRDNIKKEYCKNNNITLIEIAYIDRDKKKIDKILDKIFNI